MKKSLFLISLSLIVVLAVFLVARNGETKNRPYYSGDAISFNGEIFVGSTNSGYLEIFRLNGKSLDYIARLKNYNPRFNSYEDFHDLKFNQEDSKLFVYAVSGFSLFKYEIRNNKLEFIDESKNTYWEWYNRVDKFGDKIATVSAKGLKIWNNNLEVINSYDLKNEETPYNLRASNNLYATNVSGDYLEIHNLENRTLAKKIAINFFKKPNNHKTYQDADLNTYVVDDYYAKKYSLDGKLLGSFRHLDYEGFDITSSGNAFVYFSNGVGVVKLLATDMSLKDYAFTHSLAGHGGWAMGLSVVNNKGHDNIIIFNNTNILVLDHNLDKLASVTANEEETPYPLENLYLNLSHYSATNGAIVTVSGGGFLPNEELEITLDGNISLAQANNSGRFTKDIVIIGFKYGRISEIKSGRTDIKVTGKSSKLTYSISFTVVE